MAPTYYFLFTAGTDIEVTDSMTNGCSSRKAIRFCRIYLRGRMTMVGKCHVKPLLAIGTDDNCTLGTVWPRQWVQYRFNAWQYDGRPEGEVIQCNQMQTHVLYALRIEHLKFLLAPHCVALLYWIGGVSAVQRLRLQHFTPTLLTLLTCSPVDTNANVDTAWHS